ncbi:hypothetical protein AADG42_10260 [Ammonicoccus fulvus]|uniref:LPXTG cell wall anchor domain-containing protein n=1 Tax=Ammonicoccus fulvus TaxID=3138240 RepID=A0ABZ3FNR0_9ACTN
MTVSVSARLAAALFGSTLLLAGASVPAYADAPTKGDIKIKAPGNSVVVPGIGDKPKVPGCEVVIEIHGYTVDKGTATVDFTAKDGDVQWVGQETIDLTSGSGETSNGSAEYTVTPEGVTRGEDGYLITVKVDGSVTGAETREFWLECQPTPATPAPGSETTPGGETTTELTGETNTGDSATTGDEVADTRATDGTPNGDKQIKKVNSGGTADASGLVFLGIAGIGLAAAAGFGLNKRRKQG